MNEKPSITLLFLGAANAIMAGLILSKVIVEPSSFWCGSMSLNIYAAWLCTKLAIRQ